MSMRRNGLALVPTRAALIPMTVPWPAVVHPQQSVPAVLPQEPLIPEPPPSPADSQSGADYVDSLLADIRRDPDRWADWIRAGSADGLDHRRPHCRGQSWWIHAFTPDRRLCMTCWPVIDQGFVLTSSEA